MLQSEAFLDYFFFPLRGCPEHGGGSVPPPAGPAAQPWAIGKRVAAPAGILQNILDNGEKKQ